MAEIKINPQLSRKDQRKEAIRNWANNLSPEEAARRAAILKQYLDIVKGTGGEPGETLSDSYDSAVKRGKGGG